MTWRLPTHNELVSLLWSPPSEQVIRSAWGHVAENPEMERHYRDIFHDNYTWIWSSTPHPKHKGLILAVDFGHGCLVHLDASIPHNARLVKGSMLNSWASCQEEYLGGSILPRFQLCEDGHAVFDRYSGLTWKRTVTHPVLWEQLFST